MAAKDDLGFEIRTEKFYAQNGRLTHGLEFPIVVPLNLDAWNPQPVQLATPNEVKLWNYIQRLQQRIDRLERHSGKI